MISSTQEARGIREQQRKEIGPQAYADDIEFWSISAYNSYMAEKRRDEEERRAQQDRQTEEAFVMVMKEKLGSQSEFPPLRAKGSA